MAKNPTHSPKILRIIGYGLDLVLVSYHLQEILRKIGGLPRRIGSADARHRGRRKDILRQETAKSMVD